MLSQGFGDPGFVDQIPPGDVVVGAITAPGAAAQGKVWRIPFQTLPLLEGAWGWLTITQDVGHWRQFHDVAVIPGIDTGRVSLALVGLNVPGQLDGMIDIPAR